jgi:hypothetical protein
MKLNISVGYSYYPLDYISTQALHLLTLLPDHTKSVCFPASIPSKTKASVYLCNYGSTAPCWTLATFSVS